VTDELPVHISREELHALEVPASFEATGPFDIRLVNHGKPLHVHLHLDDPLSGVASIDASNHYVEGKSERRVRVDVDSDRLDEESLLGKLKVASAYGAQTRWINVELAAPETDSSAVEVGESLAEPQPREPESGGLLDSPAIPVLALAAVALTVAAATAVLVRNTLVVVGSLVVLAGVLAALVVLLR